MKSIALCLLAILPTMLLAQAIAPRGPSPAAAPPPVPAGPRADVAEAPAALPSGLFGEDPAPILGDLRLISASGRDDAPTPGDRSSSDYLFPRKGKSSGTLLTGMPFIGIAEYAYGFTNRFSAGVLAGRLGSSAPGYGVRFRYVVAQPSEDFRVYFKAPVIYYPKAKTLGCPDCEPWFLTWPTLNAEWRFANGVRLWTGVGVVAAACQTTIFGGKKEVREMAEGMNEGMWNTFQFGFSRRLTRRITFQLEVAPVLKGAKLASHHTWVGGPPVIVTTGISYAF